MKHIHDFLIISSLLAFEYIMEQVPHLECPLDLDVTKKISLFSSAD